MECAIVGSPLSGKTTLFQILTGQISAAAETGKRETLRGVARLRDSRLEALASIWKSRKITEVTVNYTDLPGLLTASTKREPYPARYLADIRQADMLALVARAFEDPATPHPAGSIDPARDAENARLEFILSDLEVLERRLERLAKQHDPKLAKEKE
ncbi:MAG: GTPase, partial [Calditrichota bacterium]